jgi:Flp pilus assembly protein TadD
LLDRQQQSRYAYVYAIALQSAGRREDAISVLKQNLQRHANDRETLSALINFSREAGDLRTALQYAERLARLIPHDRGLASLVDALRRDTANVSR